MAGQRFPDMWVDPEDDPRGDEVFADERSMLAGYLRDQRLTLELKCSDLDAEQLARRSVEPSTMSLLGLVRHLTDVERRWIRGWLQGDPSPNRYRSPDQRDADFDGAVADPAVVAEAFATWRAEIAYVDEVVAATDLDAGGHADEGETLREIVVHLIEEYARHNGHADLLRERIDGRTGQ